MAINNYLHILSLFLSNQFLINVSILVWEVFVHTGADPGHSQDPAKVQITEDFLLQLQLNSWIFAIHIGGQVEGGIISVRKQANLWMRIKTFM